LRSGVQDQPEQHKEREGERREEDRRGQERKGGKKRRERKKNPSTGVHSCNPTYSGGRCQEECIFRPHWDGGWGV
jgi:hypothetical protein